MAATKTKVSIAMDRELHSWIARIAKAKRQSVSGLIEGLVREGIEQEELAVKVFSDPVLSQTLVKAFGNMDTLKTLASLLGDELSDDQLRLFTERVTGITSVACPDVEKKALQVMGVKEATEPVLRSKSRGGRKRSRREAKG